MTDRPTPETDVKASPHIGFYSCATVPADFARRLERERDEAREELDELNKRLIEVSRMGVDLLIEREDLRKGVAVERALADRLAHALDRMLHLHETGT